MNKHSGAMGTLAQQESDRVASLLDAQHKAEELFAAIEARTLIRAGIMESQLSDEIQNLANELFGITKHWHRRIVRSGVNTLEPYTERPADRKVTEDDIAFLDLGPIFEAWEADFGRTYVLGNDPMKMKLRDDMEPCWIRAKARFDSEPEITGAQLFEYVVDIAAQRGWEFGADMAGHMVGEFPHEGLKPGQEKLRIWPANTQPLRGVDSQGRIRHWILELHFVDRQREIGGFFEQLLTVS